MECLIPYDFERQDENEKVFSELGLHFLGCPVPIEALKKGKYYYVNDRAYWQYSVHLSTGDLEIITVEELRQRLTQIE